MLLFPSPALSLRVEQETFGYLIECWLINCGTEIKNVGKYANDTQPLRVDLGASQRYAPIFLTAEDLNIFSLELSENERRMSGGNQLGIAKCPTEVPHNMILPCGMKMKVYFID